MRAAATGLAPAKVVADAPGRAGQELNSLVPAHSVVRGGGAPGRLAASGLTLVVAPPADASA